MARDPDNTPAKLGDIRQATREIMKFVTDAIATAPREAGTVLQAAILRNRRGQFVQANPDISPDTPGAVDGDL